MKSVEFLKEAPMFGKTPVKKKDFTSGLLQGLGQHQVAQDRDAYQRANRNRRVHGRLVPANRRTADVWNLNMSVANHSLRINNLGQY